MSGMGRTPDPDAPRVIASNRRAKHEYHLIEEFEAGLVLQGSEVKSLRQGRASIQEAYAHFQRDELFLMRAHIPEYSHATVGGHAPDRDRKLLLHRRELEKIQKRVKEKGVTLIPLSLYFLGARVKCRLALAQGKKLYDKREDKKQKDAERDMQRALGRRR
jgi:SsrA-binding protein